jgi:hypothetical protein
MNALEKILNTEENSDKWRSAVRDHAMLCRNKAMDSYKERNMDCPRKSCALCFWPAPEDMRCTKCRVVYYCHRNCQRAHWIDHKEICIATKQEDKGSEPVFPELNYPCSEWASDEDYKSYKQEAEMIETDVIHWASNIIDALMEEKDAMKKINSHDRYVYPIHRAASRTIPGTSVEFCSLLIKHGACPKIYAGDNKHLLDFCRDRAKWLRDEDASTPLSEVERKESAELVEVITEAVKNHVRCKHCKSQKATRMPVSEMYK